LLLGIQRTIANALLGYSNMELLPYISTSHLNYRLPIDDWQARPYKVEGTPVDVEEVYPRDNIDDGNQGMQSTNDTGALSVEMPPKVVIFLWKKLQNMGAQSLMKRGDRATLK